MLDTAGIRAVLVGPEVRTMVSTAAKKVAAAVPVPRGGEVVVEPYRTDREAAVVLLKHKFALGLQARDGILTRAAASAIGVTVKEKRK